MFKWFIILLLATEVLETVERMHTHYLNSKLSVK